MPLFVDGVEIKSVFVDGVDQDSVWVDGVEVFKKRVVDTTINLTVGNMLDGDFVGYVRGLTGGAVSPNTHRGLEIAGIYVQADFGFFYILYGELQIPGITRIIFTFGTSGHVIEALWDPSGWYVLDNQPDLYNYLLGQTGNVIPVELEVF